MSELITNNNGNFESSSDNVSEQLDWVNKQVIKELSDLQKEVKDNANIKKTFFNVDTEKKTVTYDMALVKDYLQSCINKEEFQINSAVVMAVQIVLESKGYDVGKIDGLLKNNKGTLSMTEQAIRKFQKENGLHVDGVPGRNTVKKILETLGNAPVEPQNSEKREDDNQKESWESEDILIGPRLQATNKSELGGVGAVTMRGICEAGNFDELQRDEKATTEKKLWFKEEQGKYKMLSYGEWLDIGDYCRERGIKSFMLCFDGNERYENFRDNLIKMGEYISNQGIQPVLCTCVGDKPLENKDISGKSNINDVIRSLGRRKKRPVIDFAKIDHDGILRDGQNITQEGYQRMGKKIEQCFSSAEK